MFLAANPYFQRRFSHHDNLLRNFQSAIMSVSTVGNLGSMLVLTASSPTWPGSGARSTPRGS